MFFFANFLHAERSLYTNQTVDTTADNLLKIKLHIEQTNYENSP